MEGCGIGRGGFHFHFPLVVAAACLLLLLLPPPAHANPQAVEYCDKKADYAVKVTGVEITPDPVVRGKPATFRISATTGGAWKKTCSVQEETTCTLFSDDLDIVVTPEVPIRINDVRRNEGFTKPMPDGWARLDDLGYIVTRSVLTAGVSISKGKLVLDVKYFGMHIHKETHDLCKETSCPVSVGDFMLSHDETLPSYAPPGSYTLIMRMIGENGIQLTCINFDFIIGFMSQVADN